MDNQALERALATYTQAQRNRADFIRKNADIFRTIENYSMSVMDAENALRDLALLTGNALPEKKFENMLVENGDYRILYYPTAERRFNEAKILEAISGKPVKAEECIVPKPRITISNLNRENPLTN